MYDTAEEAILDAFHTINIWDCPLVITRWKAGGVRPYFWIVKSAFIHLDLDKWENICELKKGTNK